MGLGAGKGGNGFALKSYAGPVRPALQGKYLRHFTAEFDWA